MKLKVLAAMAAMLLTGPAFADQSSQTWGTLAAPGARTFAAAPLAVAAAISPSFTYTNAAFTSGGIGLRNRLAGGIEISSINTPIKAAFLYWAVITNGALPNAAKAPTIARRAPTTSSAITLQGTVIGTGASPCWGGTGITVLRAPVSLSVASSAGLYEVRFPSGAGGLSNGRDPWEGSLVYPLLEGASLVMVGPGTGTTVAIYDTGHAGATIFSTYTYSLNLPVAYSGTQVTLGFIGADGQHGFSRIPESAAGAEKTTINGLAVAGSGSPYVDSLWNGSAGLPLAQLWDDANLVSKSFPQGMTKLNITTVPGNDCLTPVATIVRLK